MAPTDSSDEFMSDALGEFFIFGPPTVPSQPSDCQSLPASPISTGGGVFTFPVRSKALSSNKQLQCSTFVEGNGTLAMDATADAAATLVLLAPKQAADRGGLGWEKDIHTTKAANAACGDFKSQNACSVERGYGRSASLDTANPLGSRDQSGASSAAPGSVDDCPKALCSLSSPENPCLVSQYVAARRGGSLGGSGGGAITAAAHNQHGFWHNTEWWRSFSSSRLNEMVEETDKRSPEMLKVPYLGGAEPMCVLVHGEEATVRSV